MFCQYLYSGPQEPIDPPTLTPWTKEPGTKCKHNVEFLERHFKKLMYIKFASISGVPQAVCYISILMLEKKTAQLYYYSHTTTLTTTRSCNGQDLQHCMTMQELHKGAQIWISCFPEVCPWATEGCSRNKRRQEIWGWAVYIWGHKIPGAGSIST